MKKFKRFLEGADGGTGDKKAYQAFFNKKLKKFGVTSPAGLKDADKKKFYDEIDSEWKSDDEEDGIEEYIKSSGSRRRCSGGDLRRKANKNKVATEEDDEDCEDDEEEMEEAAGYIVEHGYNSKQIEKACKKVGMSPAEVGDFFAVLEGK